VKIRKVLKVGGFSVIAIMAVAVSIGVASASAATVLCSANQSPCQSANIKPSGTNVFGVVSPEGEDTSFTLVDEFNGKVSCSYAMVGGQTTAASGSPLPAKAESYTPPSSCRKYSWVLHEPSTETCTEMSISKPPASIVASGGGSGIMTVGTSSQHFSISYKCRESHESNRLFACTYGSSGVNYTVGAAGFSIVNAKLTLESEAGSGCLKNATLNMAGRELDGVYVSTN
jgi:hypothetical protein